MNKEFDYTESHKDIKQALNYEQNLYGDASYDSLMWGIEKIHIEREIKALSTKPVKYLDFACGTGRILSFVEKFADESVGVDVSESMLDIARGKIKKARVINCDLTMQDVLKGETYNLITAFRFFLNAQEELRQKVMVLLSGKLSDNGIFIFNNHGNLMSYHLLTVLLGKLGIKKVTLNHMSYFKVRKLIRNAGLKTIKVHGVGLVPSSVYRLLRPWERHVVKLDAALSRNQILKYFTRHMMFICSRR